MVAHQVEVDSAILRGEENINVPVAALGDVVSDTGDHDTSNSRHEATLETPLSDVKEIGGCP